MARYRHKSEEDLAWNDIRNTITAMINLEFKKARERVVNDSLWEAWEGYTKAVGQGKLPEIKATYSQFAQTVVADALKAIEAPTIVDADAAAVE